MESFNSNLFQMILVTLIYIQFHFHANELTFIHMKNLRITPYDLICELKIVQIFTQKFFVCYNLMKTPFRSTQALYRYERKSFLSSKGIFLLVNKLKFNLVNFRTRKSLQIDYQSLVFPWNYTLYHKSTYNLSLPTPSFGHSTSISNHNLIPLSHKYFLNIRSSLILLIKLFFFLKQSCQHPGLQVIYGT